MNEEEYIKPKRRKTRNFSDTQSMRSGRSNQLKPSVLKKMEKIKKNIKDDPTLSPEKKKIMLEQLPKEIMADPRNYVNENDKKKNEAELQ